MPGLDREALLAQRRALVAGGYGLAITESDNRHLVEPAQRIYVLAFSGSRGAVRLIHSGIYISGMDGEPRPTRPRVRNLVYVRWDGDIQHSTYPAQNIGLQETPDGPPYVAVASLDMLAPLSISYVDDRAFKQRLAHPITPTTPA